MPSSYQVVLWKQESFLVLDQLTPGLNTDSIRIIECRLLLQTLITHSVEAPLCQFLGDESMKSRETAFMLGMIIEGKGFHD
jgi:hypothetical protein